MKKDFIIGRIPQVPLCFVDVKSGKEYIVYKINVCHISASLAIFKGKKFANVQFKPSDEFENISYLIEQESRRRISFDELLVIYRHALKSGSY